jgi:hypothetical protein
MSEKDLARCQRPDVTHHAGCACHEQGWQNKWKAAVDMAARAEVKADQNWRFFELAAKDKNPLLIESDEWKAMAIELASYLKGGREDQDATISRFRELLNKKP